MVSEPGSELALWSVCIPYLEPQYKPAEERVLWLSGPGNIEVPLTWLSPLWSPLFQYCQAFVILHRLLIHLQVAEATYPSLLH